jgi:hypothetical protein
MNLPRLRTLSLYGCFAVAAGLRVALDLRGDGV